jgi:hypothetical protein
MRGADPWWKTLATNQISHHWRYLDYFWDKKAFVRNWRNHLEAELVEGINKGKQSFS